MAEGAAACQSLFLKSSFAALFHTSVKNSPFPDDFHSKALTPLFTRGYLHSRARLARRQ